MKASEVTALLVAVAGVVASLAAIPASSYRPMVVLVGGGLLLLALAIAVRSRRPVKPGFAIIEPRPEQTVGGEVVIRGTVPDLPATHTLWIFEEGSIDGRLVWFYGGEVSVSGNTWSYYYDSTAGPSGRARRTLSVVQADREGERQLQRVWRDDAGRRFVYPPAGCHVLGQVPMVVKTRT